MDIASLSMNLAKESLTERVGAKVLSMALKTAEDSGASLQNLLSSMETARDPALGSRLDTFA